MNQTFQQWVYKWLQEKEVKAQIGYLCGAMWASQPMNTALKVVAVCVWAS